MWVDWALSTWSKRVSIFKWLQSIWKYAMHSFVLWGKMHLIVVDQNKHPCMPLWWHIITYSSLTVTHCLCARPLPSGLTGPGAASSQIVSCVTAKADPVIVVPATAQTLPITWYEKQTACDNYKRKRRIINQIEHHCTFCSTESDKRFTWPQITWTNSQCLSFYACTITIVYIIIDSIPVTL